MKDFAENDLIVFMQQELAKYLFISPETIDINTPFDKFGIDSAKAILIVGKLEDYLDVELPSKLLWDYNTIGALSSHLHKSISLYQ